MIFRVRYESRIDQQGGTEVSPLLVQPLLPHILSSAHPHGFLNSVEIMQERSSGGGTGAATKRLAVGMWNTYGWERRCQINRRGKSHHLPCNLFPWVLKKLRVQEKLSGVKHADTEKVLNRQVGHRYLKCAPQDGGSFVWSGALRFHASWGGCLQ